MNKTSAINHLSAAVSADRTQLNTRNKHELLYIYQYRFWAEGIQNTTTTESPVRWLQALPKLTSMKIFRSTIILFFAFLAFNGYGQNCNSVSVKRDKNNGLITVSGIVTSNDFYSLLIQKQISMDDTLEPPHYLLFLNVASRVLFSDSALKTKGMFNLKLFDNSNLALEGVSFINRPLGVNSLGFKVYVDEKVIQILAANPVVTLMVDETLKTNFNLKKQKQQQKIFNCLLQ